MKINVPFNDLKKQYASIKREVDFEIQDVIENSSFILGKKVKDFEESFARLLEKKHVLGVSNGTSALHLALKAHGIGSGDEVITTPLSFIATSEAISLCNAKPVMVDINPETYCIDSNLIDDAVTSKTKAIVPVHLYGYPCNMKKIQDVAAKNNLIIVEDCAQAHLAEYKGIKVPLSTGCFSFYPGKNLGAFGDAGCVVTNDDKVAEKIMLLRDHGREKKYTHLIKGFNYRIDGLQAAILKAKLKHLSNWTRKRRLIANKYTQGLKGIVNTPQEGNNKHVFHLYVIQTDERDKLKDYLKNKGITTGIHYPTPIHLQPAYKEFKNLKLPITEEVCKNILSLPIFPEMSNEQVKYVIEKVKEFF